MCWPRSECCASIRCSDSRCCRCCFTKEDDAVASQRRTTPPKAECISPQRKASSAQARAIASTVDGAGEHTGVGVPRMSSVPRVSHDSRVVRAATEKLAVLPSWGPRAGTTRIATAATLAWRCWLHQNAMKHCRRATPTPKHSVNAWSTLQQVCGHTQN